CVSAPYLCTTYMFSEHTSFPLSFPLFFFFSAPAPPEIYTLSLHDALPICVQADRRPAGRVDQRIEAGQAVVGDAVVGAAHDRLADRKSTRLNSSHVAISYAVFCLKKKKKNRKT